MGDGCEGCLALFALPADGGAGLSVGEKLGVIGVPGGEVAEDIGVLRAAVGADWCAAGPPVGGDEELGGVGVGKELAEGSYAQSKLGALGSVAVDALGACEAGVGLLDLFLGEGCFRRVEVVQLASDGVRCCLGVFGAIQRLKVSGELAGLRQGFCCLE